MIAAEIRIRKLGWIFSWAFLSRRPCWDHFPEYNHRCPKYPGRTWRPVGVWRWAQYSNRLCRQVHKYYLWKFSFKKLKICATGGAIRDLVFENLVIGGEQIEEMDHFYTNQYVHDLQFSWCLIEIFWKYRLWWNSQWCLWESKMSIWTIFAMPWRICIQGMNCCWHSWVWI